MKYEIQETHMVKCRRKDLEKAYFRLSNVQEWAKSLTLGSPEWRDVPRTLDQEYENVQEKLLALELAQQSAIRLFIKRRLRSKGVNVLQIVNSRELAIEYSSLWRSLFNAPYPSMGNVTFVQ